MEMSRKNGRHGARGGGVMHISPFDFDLYDAMRVRFALKRLDLTAWKSKPESNPARKENKRAKVKAARKQRRRQS